MHATESRTPKISRISPSTRVRSRTTARDSGPITARTTKSSRSLLTDPRLDQALSDERAGRFLESFRHCLGVLGDNPRNAGALALASRLSMLAGDAANAIAYACEAVRIDGEHPEAQQALNVARQPRSATSEAIAA